MLWILVMAVGLVVAGLIIGILMHVMQIASAKIDGLEARVKMLLPLAEERRLLERRLGEMAHREDALWEALGMRDTTIARPQVYMAGTASWWHYDEYFRELKFNKYEQNHGGVQLAKRVAPWPSISPERGTDSAVFEGP